MTWAALAYAAIGYYYFRLTLRHIEQWDSAGTVLLNAALALTVGPLLLVPTALYGWVTRGRAARPQRQYRAPPGSAVTASEL